jgi:branched-chain amino acid transport system substrate-binding protein
MRFFAGLAGAAAVAALTVSACSNSNSNVASGGALDHGDGPLKIGVIVPLSGPSGPNGKEVLNAIQVEADAWNKAGGIEGRKIEVVSADDKSTPADGVTAANHLASEHVDVVMGGWNSPVTLAIQPILVRAGILNITTIPQSSEILGGADPDAVRMNAGNQVGGYVAADYLSKELGAKKVGFMLENDAYGDDAGSFLSKYLPSDVKVVTQQKFDVTSTDFRVPISNLKAAKPDAVFSADASEASGQPALMKQLGQASLGVPYFAGLGTVSQTVVDLAGSGSEGSYSADLYFPDQKPWSTIPKNQNFVTAFKAKTGDLPNKYAALGAESVDVWAKAAQKAGTTDRDKVASAIKGQSFDDTVLGSVKFTAGGQMVSDIYVFKIKGQKPSIVSKVDVPDTVWGK